MKKNLFVLFIIMGACSVLKGQNPQDSLKQFPADTAAIRIEPSQHTSDTTLPAMNVMKDFKAPEKHECLYHYKPAIDIPVTIVGMIGAPLGFYLVNKKPSTDTTIILNLDPQRD